MCGILGVHDALLPDRERFTRALARLRERGPDGSGTIERDGWRVAVQRLAITDAAAGQPLAAPDGLAWIAFNGSIADAEEERRRLLASGRAIRTRNDAELALRAWLDDGEAGIARLRGMFAFGILDATSKQLVLARDRFGEKPLFLAWRKDRVEAFASTAAALAELVRIRAPSAPACAAFLARGWLSPELAADGLAADGLRVTALPPGHVLVQGLDRGAATVRAFGEHEVPEEHAPLSASAAPRVVRAALVEAAGLQARAETPVGLFLSGGLDSAALAAACREAGREVVAFTLRCEGEPDDESVRAATVASALGFAHQCHEALPDVLDALPALTGGLGLPVGDPSMLLVHALALRARSTCRVVLGGEGADELFQGYRRYALLPWIARARALVPPSLLAALARRAGSGRTPLARLARAVAARDPYGSLLEVTSPELLATVLTDPASSSRDDPVCTPAAAAARDLGAYLPLDLLVKLDHGLMSAGVEGRCPYLDRAVVRAAARVPAGLRRQKKALRAAFADVVPRAVRSARKRGFALPLDRWLARHPLVPDVLLSRPARERGLFRRQGLEALVARVRGGPGGFGLPAFLACALELHLQSVDKSAHA